MKEGDPIYVESLLNTEEYMKCAGKYNTYRTRKTVFFTSEFMWRYRMGESLPEDKILLMNKRFSELLQKVK